MDKEARKTNEAVTDPADAQSLRSLRVRPHLLSMAGYVPGEQPGRAGVIKLNTNEHPFPPAPGVVAALHAAVDGELRKYPPPRADALRRRIAALHGWDEEGVLLGNGSDDLLGIIARACVGPGDLVAAPLPGYSLYQTLVALADGRFEAHDYPEDYRLPESLYRTRARLIFVATPNSPSGTQPEAAAVSRLLERAQALIVLDEAYVDFAERDFVDLARGQSQVCILRSFSKSYALAGLRIGYLLGQPALVRELDKARDSYNLGRLAQAAAAAALDDMAYMREQARRIRELRAWFSQELRALGCFVWPSQANFVLARLCQPRLVPRQRGIEASCGGFDRGRDAGPVYRALKDQGIFVRHFDTDRLRDCLRISIGRRDELEACLAALRQALLKG